MKSMKTLLACSCIIAVFSCAKPHYQVYHTKCLNCKPDTFKFVGGDDSVEVEYYFWNLDGSMLFAVNNKTSNPIYIDWKRSGFYRDNERLEYWQDQQFISTKSMYLSGSQITRYWVNNPAWYGMTAGASTSIVNKKERVTFVISKSLYTYQPATHVICPQRILLHDDDSHKRIVRLDNEEMPVFNKYYKDKPALSFRNYITWLYNEDDASGKIIDNTFHVVEIEEMPELWFLSQYNKPQPGKFFKILPLGGYSLEERQKGIYPY